MEQKQILNKLPFFKQTMFCNKTVLLFVICLIVSSPAWFLVKLQVKDMSVDPTLAVGIRMILAGTGLEIWRRFYRKEPSLFVQKLPWALLIFQGLSLYGINLLLAYEASKYIVSGFIAIAFCAMILPNLVLGQIIFGRDLTTTTIIGSSLGIGGLALCYLPEFMGVPSMNSSLEIGLMFALAAMCFSVVGTQFTSALSSKGLSPYLLTAVGMMIGGAATLSYWAITSTQLSGIDSLNFWIILFYLAFIVTTISNLLFIMLIGKIGPGKASFLWSCVPITALAFSSFVEDFIWTELTTVGAFVIFLGGVLLTRKGRPIHLGSLKPIRVPDSV